MKIFEVEESTDFRDAFVKFLELQDFNTQFFCISHKNRKIKFEREINKVAFQILKERCIFRTYEEVENDYLNIYGNLRKPKSGSDWT